MLIYISITNCLVITGQESLFFSPCCPLTSKGHPHGTHLTQLILQSVSVTKRKPLVSSPSLYTATYQTIFLSLFLIPDYDLVTQFFSIYIHVVKIQDILKESSSFTEKFGNCCNISFLVNFGFYEKFAQMFIYMHNFKNLGNLKNQESLLLSGCLRDLLTNSVKNYNRIYIHMNEQVIS